MHGDSGDDLITGGAFQDVAYGGADSDTIVGGGADDQLDGGEGDDVLNGEQGNDTLYGQTGTDRCSGGAGNDMCDGGTPGTPVPTPDDPDICDGTVETKVNCRGDSANAWDGTAAGKLTYNGIIESWTATYGMNLTLDGGSTKVYGGNAVIDWSIGGTTPQGCAYSGKATVTGKAQLTVYASSNEYAHQVSSPYQYVPVQVTCPITGTTTQQIRPLNADAASTSLLAQPNPPTTPPTFSGTRDYTTTNGLQASWGWTVTGK
jgi:hypothetical protein